jgi:hypothetical protein
MKKKNIQHTLLVQGAGGISLQHLLLMTSKTLVSREGFDVKSNTMFLHDDKAYWKSKSGSVYKIIPTGISSKAYTPILYILQLKENQETSELVAKMYLKELRSKLK